MILYSDESGSFGGIVLGGGIGSEVGLGSDVPGSIGPIKLGLFVSSGGLEVSSVGLSGGFGGLGSSDFFGEGFGSSGADVAGISGDLVGSGFEPGGLFILLPPLFLSLFFLTMIITTTTAAITTAATIDMITIHLVLLLFFTSFDSSSEIFGLLLLISLTLHSVGSGPFAEKLFSLSI